MKLIKWVALAGAVGTGFAFAAGTYVGWKTTMKAFETVSRQVKDAS